MVACADQDRMCLLAEVPGLSRGPDRHGHQSETLRTPLEAWVAALVHPSNATTILGAAPHSRPRLTPTNPLLR